MRTRVLVLATAAILFVLSFEHTSALPCKWTCQDTTGSHGGKPHAFYSFEYGQTWLNTSPAFNNWALSQGLSPNHAHEYMLGFGEVLFSNRWMFEMKYNVVKNFGYSNPAQISNVSLGAGYRLWQNNLFSLYGAAAVGLNEFDIYPTQSTVNELGKTDNAGGVIMSDYALLVNPKVMLYRDITPDLNIRTRCFDKIAVGLEAGYNATFLQGPWMYQLDNKPFADVSLPSIPRTGFSGFYLMGKIGWHFGGK